jgi:hypothetical protein
VYAFGMLTYEVMAKKDPYSDQDCSLVEILKEIVKVSPKCIQKSVGKNGDVVRCLQY